MPNHLLAVWFHCGLNRPARVRVGANCMTDCVKGRKSKPMKFRIKSRTGKAVYTVRVNEKLKPGQLPCDCLAGLFRRRCWHIREAKRMLELGLVSASESE